MPKRPAKPDTPLIWWEYASQFYHSGSALIALALATKLRNGIIPPYYLFTHSIELSLKVFLRCKGYTSTQLRIQFGHDLGATLAEACANGLDEIVRLDDDEKAIIRYLGSIQLDHRLRYGISGWLHLPGIEQLRVLAQKLHHGMTGLVYETATRRAQPE